ncbi:cupredoxin domain-containing protein [Polynucleobacter sp. AP-Nino-20-G2]|uniref:cupredoxin domain-containing protein n=1 Tax=Polynucleobacter sp. AP-Nino-20-G2 TaxID=2576917 RepID=UPI001BFDBD42|nr:cupredoxin domain-containing protein [Polynucleobacter sp. AP-Nino-20-G2]
MKNTVANALFCLMVGVATLASANPSEITIKIQKGRFSPSQIEIPADTKVRLVIQNLDDTPEEFESHELNREVLIKANGSASFYIGPLSPGLYKFEGEFSPETAQGVVIVK